MFLLWYASSRLHDWSGIGTSQRKNKGITVTDRKSWLMILMMHLLMMMMIIIIIIMIMMMWGNTVDCDENACDSFMNSISTHTHAHILLLQNQVYSRQHMQGVYHTIWLCLKQSTGQSQFFHIVPIKVIKMAISMVVCPILILAQPYHPSKICQASIAQWSWNWQPHHHPFATTVSTCDNQ